jgi:D-3-phosphoglycerate dehydrogenase
MPKVLVTATGHRGDDDPRFKPLRDAGWDVKTHRWPGGRPDEEEVIELVHGYDAVIASSNERYTRAVFERADTLKHVARWGVGYETVDVPAASDNGVIVTTTQGSNHWAVADHAWALMLAVSRRVVELDKIGRSRTWSRPLGSDIWQKTLGVVGLGRIGKGVAQRAFGFEMKVVAYEPYPDRAFCEKWNIELVDSIEEVFRQGDFVTLHAPGDNVSLANAERLALMKPTAVLINTARGALVDEDALYDALKAGKVAGAGLDVREHEPPEDERDDRFVALANVVLTPHISGSTHEAQAVSAVMVVEQIIASNRGEVPHGVHNPEIWERRRK